MRAGLLPLVADQCSPVLIDATARDTEVRLIKGLRQVHKDLPESESLVELCDHLSDEPQPHRAKTMIVLDQFEQWLQSNSDYENSQLASALQRCNGIQLQAIFLVRDDFWMPLTRFMDVLEVSLQENRNISAIDLFDHRHAKKVLTEFGRAYGRLTEGELTSAEEEFLDQAVDQLQSNGRIISVRLSLFAEMLKSRPWTTQELRTVGGAKGVGQTFLEQSFGPQAPINFRRHATSAQNILSCLLPPYGSDIKGQMRSADDIFTASAITARREFEQCMELLNTDLKLVTPVTADSPDGSPACAENNRATSYYQLTHDYLVPSIRDFLNGELRRTPSGRARLTLKERGEDWERHHDDRHLPTFWEWLSIRRFVAAKNWSELQAKMMKRLDALFLTRIAGTIVCIALAALGIRTLVMNSLADSLAQEVLKANTSEVPQIAQHVKDMGSWIRPKLIAHYDSEFQNSAPTATEDKSAMRRWLHLNLVIDDKRQEQRRTSVVRQLSQVPVEDLEAVVQLLIAPAQGLATTDDAILSEWLKTSQQISGADLMAKAALASQTTHGKTYFEKHADKIVEHLCESQPTHFPYWLKNFDRHGSLLTNALIQKLKKTPVTEGVRRSQLVNSIAQFAANDAKSLIAAIEIADPEEFAVLIPPLRKVVKRSDWEVQREREFDSSQIPELHQSLQDYKGALTNRGGLALAVPQPETRELIQLAQRSGFRPISVRPYQTDQAVLAAIVFNRDSRDFRFAEQLSQEELVELNSQYESANFQIVDFAVTPAQAPNDVLWWAVWEETMPGDFTRKLDVSLPAAKPDRDAHIEEMNTNGFVFHKYIVFPFESGERLISACWEKRGSLLKVKPTSSETFTPPEKKPKIVFFWGNTEWFGDYRPGLEQFEIRHYPPSKYIAVYLDLPSKDKTRLFFRKSADRVVAQLQRSELDDMTPILAAPEWDAQEQVAFFSTVWRAPVPDPTQASERVQRLANRALAAAFCGVPAFLNDYLSRESEERGVSTYLIENLSKSRFPVSLLQRELTATKNHMLQRSLLLALGEYPSHDVDSHLSNHLVRLAQAKDAGVTNAASWCLKKWRIPSSSVNQSPSGSNWRINKQGKMLIQIKPKRFRMGSPVYEEGRTALSEQQNWMQIPRTYELAATHTTVRDFLAFLNDPLVQERVPSEILAELRKRAELTDTTWHLDCPMPALRRRDTMMYCEWLSEVEGIHVDERCYPGIWSFVSQSPDERTLLDQKYGYRPPQGFLEKSGYRLPTEAEYEYAARAGGDQARFFGNNDQFLSSYAWNASNSMKKSWPTGILKPNHFGFFDILGNANQHCADLYLSYRTPYDNGGMRTDTIAEENKDGDYSIRGGDFSSPPEDVRSANRSRILHSNNGLNLSLRLCRTIVDDLSN